MMDNENNDSLSLKIPILHRTVPYIYIKTSITCNSYRLSGNYKYLNEHYNLKINFIRDLDKINNDNKNNKYFILDNNNNINIKDGDKWQKWKIGSDTNNELHISRLIVDSALGASTIIILQRKYFEDINYSIFFSSTNYFNINSFLQESN